MNDYFHTFNIFIRLQPLKVQYPEVLIVDDDEDDRELLHIAFVTNNITSVALYEDGHSVLKYLSLEAKVLPKLIISDFNMPTLTGFELLVKVKAAERFKEIPVVIMSAHKPKAQVENCLKAGAEGYFQKPSSLDKIIELVREVIISISLQKQM